jgi:hypothetical protein
MSRKTQLLFAWTGPVLVVLFFIGFIPVAGFIPQQSPAASAVKIAHWYRTNTTGIRIGCVLMLMAFALFAPWGGAMAVQIRKMEQSPTGTYALIACLACGLVIAISIPLVWAIAAYRPADVSPDITRMLNDAGWFLFLFTWPPFSVWCAVLAVAIFRDESEVPRFPRWSGYLNIWTAILFAPAALMLFFKTGPFSYRGLIAMYIVVTVFFAWMTTMTVLLIRAIKRDAPVETALPTAENVRRPVLAANA